MINGGNFFVKRYVMVGLYILAKGMHLTITEKFLALQFNSDILNQSLFAYHYAIIFLTKGQQKYTTKMLHMFNL